MTNEIVWIHSSNQTPKLGSGRRIVRATVGRKWATLETSTGRERITLSTYNQIRRDIVRKTAR